MLNVYLLLFLLFVLISVLITLLARWYSIKNQLMDQPGERRSHIVATPRGGGVAIVGSVLLAQIIIINVLPELTSAMTCWIIGLILVAGIGWWDDHRPLSAKLRLVVQMVAAILAIIGFYILQPINSFTEIPFSDVFNNNEIIINQNILFNNPPQWSFILFSIIACVFIVGLINVWNFMDGINGIATTQAGLVAIILFFLLPPPLNILAFALLAGCLGFLPFNFPKARIFLGDVGSGALGYILALLILLVWRVETVAWPLLLLPISAFLIDSGLTLLSRILTKQQWWTPHTQHIYQRWAKKQASHSIITLKYIVFTVLSIVLLCWVQESSMMVAIFSVSAWLTFSSLLWLMLRKKLRNY